MEEHLNQPKSTADTELHTKLLPNDHHQQKGGMKTMPFIIVNEAFERIAGYGLLTNMIFYLMEAYHMEAVAATTVIYIWSALSNGLSVFGAFISDSYLGRFHVIAIGSLSSLIGVTLLWLTSMVPQLTPSSCHEPNVTDTGCSEPTTIQFGVLFASVGLISIGSGCIRPCSIAFGADQLKQPNNQRLIDSYFNWYYASAMISTAIGSTVVVYIQDQFGWRVGFAVPALFMLCSALMFVLGSPLYVKVKVKGNLYSEFIQVLIMAFKNRRIRLLPGDRFNHGDETARVELTDNLRFLNQVLMVRLVWFLNKACVVSDTCDDYSGLDSQKVPTVEKVESLKSFIRIIPISSSGILVFANIVQNIPTLEAKKMNRNITSWFEFPAASFNLFTLLTLTIWIAFYDRILIRIVAKFTHEPRGLDPKTRMGIGIIVSVIAMAVAAIVESVRRDLANSNMTSEMSAMWLVPQFVLLGLTEALNGVGQLEFYYSELSKSMASLAMALSMVNMAVAALVASLVTNIVDAVTKQGGGVSWLSSDIDEGHVDYYYWLFSFLNLLNFFYYLFCCRVHRSFSSPQSRLSHEISEQ